MTTQHQEIERKFEAADGIDIEAVLAAAGIVGAGVPRTTHHLDATYFDTPDRRLLGARVTLRRRSGGDDEGWHLKLPASAEARLEIHRGLGRSSRPPASLTQLLTAVTGDAVLEPAAVIRTTRVSWPIGGTGRVLALVAEDDVSAHRADRPGETQHWREIEVELVDGDLQLLDRVEAVLGAAGVSRSPSASKVGRVLGADVPAHAHLRADRSGAVVHRYLVEQVDALVTADLQVRTTDASVHDLRVASRRLRTTFAVYRKLFDDASARHLQAEMRWIGQVLGDLRDVEVTHRLIRKALDSDPAPAMTRGAVAPIEQLIAPDERAARDAVRACLASDRYARALGALHEFVHATPWAPRAARRSSKLAKRLAKPEQLLRAAVGAAESPDGGDAERHEIRKVARRLRYAYELAEPAAESLTKRRRECHLVQSALGDYLDTRRLEATLWRLHDADVSTPRAFVYGRLHRQAQLDAAVYLDDARGRVAELMGLLDG